MTSAAAPPPYRHARTIFLSVSAAGVVAAIVIGQSVLLPFLLAVVLAYVLFPLVWRVERARVPRWAAIVLVYLVTIGAAVGFSWSVVPRLFDEVKSLAADLPRITARIRNDLLPKIDARLQRWGADAKDDAAASGSATAAQPPPIVITPRGDGAYEIRFQDDIQLRPGRDGAWVVTSHQEEQKTFSSARALRDAFDRSIAHLQSNSAEVVKVGRQIIGGISRGIFYFFITLMLAGYMMLSYERIHAFFREMWPEYRRASFDKFVARLDRGLAGVVRGQVLICLVNGILTAIGLWIFDLKYWPVLALIAGMMSIIPIFGSILSSVPAVAIGLSQSPGTAIGVLLWIIGIHQLEANFLNPKIIGDQAKIHPVLVVFALLLGESLFAITGALLAVPCLALVQAVFMHFRESVLGLPSSESKPKQSEVATQSAETLPAGETPVAEFEIRAPGAPAKAKTSAAAQRDLLSTTLETPER